MMITFDGRFPSLNEQIKADRNSSFIGNKLKKKYTSICAWSAKAKCNDSFTKPVHVDFYWYEPNKKRDKDNIAFAKKYILDGLVSAGIIKNDGWAGVHSFSDNFAVDKDNPRVEIEIREI